ncbi:MAG: 2-amino-4-hydroxy-6-hydroxymethyldihydropteridine diphosphokinase [Verrucomicrobia bacterium]|nr:2-amino-4-hydroxy-6-hydroxymethyldihydropteridine diphosphokinase [Verrucomicrobiota bacterium]
MEYGLSLGSNLGDRLAHLQEARLRLGALPGVGITASSAVYETEPVDVDPAHADQSFLNAVVVITTALAPEPMAEAMWRIETELGRVRTGERHAPRPVDIDMLYASQWVLRGDRLKVPHPRWQARRFVVQPLADVRPDLVVPGQVMPVSDVLLALPPKPDVVLFTHTW